MILESGITRRRQSKNVHGSLSFFLAPIPRYFSFRPIPHLGACSQTNSRAKEQARIYYRKWKALAEQYARRTTQGAKREDC